MSSLYKGTIRHYKMLRSTKRRYEMNLMNAITRKIFFPFYLFLYFLNEKYPTHDFFDQEPHALATLHGTLLGPKG